MQQCIWSILESRFRPIQLETPRFAKFLTLFDRRAASSSLLWQGIRTPSHNRNSSGSSGGSSGGGVSFLERPTCVSPTTTFLIEAYARADLTDTQFRSLLAATRLATNATTMAAARTQKDAAAIVANDTPTKAGSSAPNKRRRRPGEQRFYAVRAGKIPGVYLTWAECQAMINGFAGANYKSFGTAEEAELYVAGKNPNPDTAPTRFYAVAVGNKPGIYTEWTEAQAAYVGVKAPKYKKFDTREAAEEWLQGFGDVGQAPAALKEDDVDEEDELDDASPAAKKVKVASEEIAVVVQGELDEDLLEIYTDGSTLANGQNGAVAGVGVFFGDGDPRNISERLSGSPQTNQRAELTAILRALETVPVTQGVMIWSDSMYAINCVTEWFVKWEKNGWKTHKGQVQNRDLVEAVLVKIREREAEGTTTLIKWIKGHESSKGNISADKLAVGGAHLAKSSQAKKGRR
ncbi:Ribonuclease H [Cytospora mali]|uniref:ribonuclease H n=1 Tax=Cytospora mali TaxID=578113 RepID=A0A194VUW6_CYTMA|nr:Ribonuclease H [Valsa mali]